MRIWQDDRVPFDEYAAHVRARYPSPPDAGPLEIPTPPDSIGSIYVEPLLRWTYRDPDLTVRIVGDR